MQIIPEPVYVAVSSCLLGENVRYDGTNCHNNYINGNLTKFLKLIPVCPENLIGLGTPRPPIQLVQTGDEIRSIGVLDRNKDVTAQLRQCAEHFMLQHPDISGIILKSKSPSCGLNTTKLFDQLGQLIHNNATGIFAAMIQTRSTCIDVCGEDRLELIQDRLEFFTRVYAFSRLKRIMKSHEPMNALKKLHQQYFPLIRIISPGAADHLDYIILNACVSQNKTLLINTYYDDFCQIISEHISRDMYGQYLQQYLAEYFNLKQITAIEFAIEKYISGDIEWPEVQSRIDQAGSEDWCMEDGLGSLLPLSILA
jgi:uncharacterized protein YbbK (DUF523 family)/uncharacterized protein YbgA (DUF1722 family)